MPFCSDCGTGMGCEHTRPGHAADRTHSGTGSLESYGWNAQAGGVNGKQWWYHPNRPEREFIKTFKDDSWYHHGPNGQVIAQGESVHKDLPDHLRNYHRDDDLSTFKL